MAPATKIERANRPRSSLSIAGNGKQEMRKARHDGRVADGDKRDSTNAGHDTNDAGLSFSQRVSQLPPRTPTPLLVKGDRLLRDIDRAPPGDPFLLRSSRRRSLLSLSGNSVRSVGSRNGGGGGGGDGGDGDGVGNGGHDLSRRRSQYFEDAFSARDGNRSLAKERVRSEAFVLADVRTNVFIGDEFTVITELSAHLALRYRRPLSSVVVTLEHNACMCFGGSFDPAYTMAVFALPAELQPATNKRNAALIQKHMEEALGVSAARGLLRFAPVPESNLAYGGKTATGHADDAAKTRPPATTGLGHKNSVGGSGDRRAAGAATPDVQSLVGSVGSRRNNNKAARKLSVKSLSSFRSPSPAPDLDTPPHPPPPAARAVRASEERPRRPPTPLRAIPEQRSLQCSPQRPQVEAEQNAEPVKEEANVADLRAAAVAAAGIDDATVNPMELHATAPASSQRRTKTHRTRNLVTAIFGGRSKSSQEARDF
ncbi:mif domain containing protein [Niveomyces insectorum RCEF 264]|uniref:L-dopachrome isomerase n=1 Tax=Niveomyces insectorum RCEF 264 TaxID=1081102 RepID=A0A168A1N2_9HYPO|nr:mif domain containing protein [Niveomyces insectorum RCEF 264]